MSRLSFAPRGAAARRALGLSSLALLASAVVGTAPAAAASLADPAYHAQELVGPGGHSMWPAGLGPRGLVVGHARGDIADTSSRWSVAFTPNGRYRAFMPFDTPSSDATAANASGAIAGWYFDTAAGQVHPYVRQPDGSTTDLLAGSSWGGTASGINASGAVVGTLTTPSQSTQGFVWRDGRLHTLGDLGGGETNARAINDAGVMVGESQDAGHRYRAFRYQAGQMVQLPSLPVDVMQSRANAIAADGAIAGATDITGGPSVATLWPADGGAPVQLPGLPGSTTGGGNANGVNASHDVVGSAFSAAFHQRAVLWHLGEARDLNGLVVDLPPGVALKDAVAINEAGQIVVNGYDQDKHRRHFLLTPLVAR